jgi:hypothetical protein
VHATFSTTWYPFCILVQFTLSMSLPHLVVHGSLVVCSRRENKFCSAQLPVHQRMNANGVLLPNDLFS